MRVKASAPGKIMISGEYAVLSGAAALVMAVNRRVEVSLEASASWRLSADGGPDEVIPDPHFLQREEQPQTAVALALWCASRALGTRPEPMKIHIDSRPLQQAGSKLGLGSSAAVSVALTAALAHHEASANLSLDTCLRTHDALQGTAGSGFDVAAAWQGGCFAFRREAAGPCIQPMTAPPAALCFVWTGQIARTAGFVQRYRQWERSAAESQGVIAALGNASGAALQAAEHGDGEAFVAALTASGSGLAALADAASLPIFAGGHEQLLAIAGACQVAYKPCGAGGGDLGIASACDASRLSAFMHAARGQGYSILSMECDPHGVRVEREEAQRIAHP